MKAIEKRYGTVLRCYDNGGKTCDRYTIIPPRWAGEVYRDEYPALRLWCAIGSNAAPFHPQGFGMHVSAAPGPHLGKRIHWGSLPADVQKFARQSFPEFAPEDRCRQTACKHCSTDIEGFSDSPAVWRDRGSDTKCNGGPNDGKPHAPVPDFKDGSIDWS